MELDLKDLKELLLPNAKTGYEDLAGKNIFVRTVTHHFCGHCIDVKPQCLHLIKCSWVADDGRFHEGIADQQKLGEVEPYPASRVIHIGIGAIIDACEYGDLPDGVR